MGAEGPRAPRRSGQPNGSLFAPRISPRPHRDRAWYTWYIEAVASGRIAVANGRIFPVKCPDPRPYPSLWVRLRPFSTRLAEGSIPGASTRHPRELARGFARLYQGSAARPSVKPEDLRGLRPLDPEPRELLAEALPRDGRVGVEDVARRSVRREPEHVRCGPVLPGEADERPAEVVPAAVPEPEGPEVRLHARPDEVPIPHRPPSRAAGRGSVGLGHRTTRSFGSGGRPNAASQPERRHSASIAASVGCTGTRRSTPVFVRPVS